MKISRILLTFKNLNFFRKHTKEACTYLIVVPLTITIYSIGPPNGLPCIVPLLCRCFGRSVCSTHCPNGQRSRHDRCLRRCGCHSGLSFAVSPCPGTDGNGGRRRCPHRLHYRQEVHKWFFQLFSSLRTMSDNVLIIPSLKD